MSDVFNALKFIDAEKKTSSLNWLDSINDDACAPLSGHTFPTRKTENWKYTSLKILAKGDFQKAVSCLSENAQKQSYDAVKDRVEVEGLDSTTIVFVDGFFSNSLSDDFLTLRKSGVNCVLFSNATQEQQKTIKETLANKVSLKKHIFAALNSHLLSEGFFVSVDKNVQCEKPLRIVHVNTTREKQYSSQARLLVTLASGASLEVIEQFVSQSESTEAFVNSVSEFDIADNASLTHYRLHEEHENIIHIGALHFELNKFARLSSFHMALGGSIKRIDIDTHLVGEGAESNINGVYLPKGSQHIDFHTCTEHVVPNCTSNESFRGIVADSAQAVFNGRIHIHPDAQKTLAELSNKNLLLSNKATINTKPELEIYADDVKCAHGATIAQLNDESLHYMMTRGISRDEAKVMLSFGFINELINDIKNDALGDHLRPLLTTVFCESPELLRHIT